MYGDIDVLGVSIRSVLESEIAAHAKFIPADQ